nr:hypothetical protein [Xylophilus rhododendri]
MHHPLDAALRGGRDGVPGAADVDGRDGRRRAALAGRIGGDGGQGDQPARPVPLQGGAERGRVGDVARLHEEAAGQGGEVGQHGGQGRGQVETHHLPAAPQQVFGQRQADESAGPGDEGRHAPSAQAKACMAGTSSGRSSERMWRL